MQGFVRFSLRRIIDKDSQSTWDKALFDATWFEYKLQIQNFGNFARYESFADFLKNEPNAETIHSRVSPAVYPSIQILDGKLPVVYDANGESLALNQFYFEIQNSDFLDQSKHKISVDLISKQFFLISSSANGFLVCDASDADDFQNGQELRTLLIANQHLLNIYSFKKS
ncbi:hypothetical protein [Flavobacterium sp.]|uniref:hypothetical protein n=1 Tax=Flavobacterium sp. TaxID=239 RepID=UPI001220E44E|nr:hypothetical protein [Flavobacterium sp.]RZJ71925.1 MAG: hypothetical protein EOO49_07805 [Flavobacterium sp.]